MTDSTKKLTADLWWDEIRNPQLAECSDKLSQLVSEYGLRDIEFEMVIEMTREEMFSYSYLIDEDDEEESEET